MWKNNKPEGEVVIIDNGKIKKQLWEDEKPLKYLEDGETKFEKIIEIIIKEQKKKIKRAIEDDE